MPGPLILASTSRYRGELLGRLLPRFEQMPPDADESVRADESPAGRARRLATLKARSVSGVRPGAIVLGSDQVATLDGEILHKPGDADTACAQLARCSGHTAVFHTAVSVVAADGGEHAAMDTTRCCFRRLDTASIERYVTAEQPLECAGSFQCEGLGIALFERIETEDPTALIGLPLIALARLLRECGLEIP